MGVCCPGKNANNYKVTPQEHLFDTTDSVLKLIIFCKPLRLERSQTKEKDAELDKADIRWLQGSPAELLGFL